MYPHLYAILMYGNAIDLGKRQAGANMYAAINNGETIKTMSRQGTQTHALQSCHTTLGCLTARTHRERWYLINPRRLAARPWLAFFDNATEPASISTARTSPSKGTMNQFLIERDIVPGWTPMASNCRSDALRRDRYHSVLSHGKRTEPGQDK